MASEAYLEKLRDGRWQKRRAEIIERDRWACRWCHATADSGAQLVVHHLIYVSGREPWEYADDELITICWDCHQEEHDTRPGADADLVRAAKLAGWPASELAALTQFILYLGYDPVFIELLSRYVREPPARSNLGDLLGRYYQQNTELMNLRFRSQDSQGA
jgi:hypothetical protein